MTDSAPKAVGADFPAEREAFRPDGAKIPADASALAAPKPPPVPKGFLDQVEGVQIRDPKKPSAATGRLVTPEVELTVAEAGGVDTLPGDGRVALRGPAEGEQLRALSFVLTARDVKRDLSRNVAPTYAVQVGSVRKPIVIPIEAGPDEEPARVTLVAGVPKGQDAQLVMTVAGVEQTMSITTGERTSKTVPAYYRSSTEVVLNKQYGPARVTIGRFGIEHKVRFTRVEVLPYVWYAGWAKPGTVWLQFHYEDFNLRKTTTIDYYEDPVFSGEKSLSLTDDQGRKYPYNAKGLPVLEEYGGGASFAMAVSDTAKSVTLTYAPTGTFEPDPSWVHQAKPQRGAIAFKPLTVPIALPQ